MTTRDAEILVRQMLECFNTRRFDQAAELFTTDFHSHPLGTTGFAAGRKAWQTLVTHFPEFRVVIEDVLVDGDKVAVRSSIEGVTTLANNARPTLLEIFRVDDGRIAEMWGLGQGLPLEVLRANVTDVVPTPSPFPGPPR